jgi:transcriptional regulator with XRE-family HTH domain
MMNSLAGSNGATAGYFGLLLRRWRVTRRVSQLWLALEADLSARHLSCVETGRAQPSRETVLRLAEALQIPLRERNTLLIAAGFAPRYHDTDLDAPEMKAAKLAIDLLLEKQEPYPVAVTDRLWNTVRMNEGMRRFLARFPIDASVTPHNGVRFVFHPHGLRPYLENWDEVASRIIQRIHREVAVNPGDETMREFLEELLGYPGVPDRWRNPDVDAVPPPLLTLDYRCGRERLRFFGTVTTFGTAQDVALQEIRIESFFPADEATRVALTAGD